MLVMPTLRKPVLYNETIAGMSNKTHEGIFLDIMLRKGTSYNGIKTTQLKKSPNTKTNQKMTTKIPKNPHQLSCFKSDFIATKYGTVI